MKNKIEVLGFYKRKRDGNEYVLYREGNRVCMTNGIFIWRDLVEKKYLPQCEKIESIDLKNMIENLHKYFPYHLLLGELNSRNIPNPERCVYVRSADANGSLGIGYAGCIKGVAPACVFKKDVVIEEGKQ